jgi:metal-responsive CopG/Arc/MetJ family transcriptional regulator
MKDKRIYVRVTEEFLKKLEYLKEINGFKNLSETMRKIVEKEYRKEKECECTD